MPLFYESYGEPIHVHAPAEALAAFAYSAGLESPEAPWLFHEGVYVANPHHVAPEFG